MFKWIYIVIILLFGTAVSFAQTEEEVLPAERKQLTIITEPFTLYKGFFRAGVALQYSALYKIFDEEGNRVLISNASGRSWTSLLILQYGITDRIQVAADLPYQTQDLFLSFRAELPGEIVQFKLEGSGSGIGDASIGVSYQLLTETITRPSVKVTATGIIPTGEKNPTELTDFPVGSGHYALDVALSLRKISYPFSYSAFTSYKLNMSGAKQFDFGGPETSFNDGDLLTISAAFNFHMNEWLALTNDFYYFYSFADEENGQVVPDTKSWTVQYTPRLSFQIKRLRVNQVIQIPLFGKLSGADPGFILIVQYVF